MRYFARVGDVEREFRFERRGGALIAHAGDRTYHLDLCPVGDGSAFSVIVDGRVVDVIVEHSDAGVVVQAEGYRVRVDVEDERERAAHAVAGSRGGGKQEIRAPMPGSVVDVLVSEGDVVEEGRTLLVLEAMKMQNPIQAEARGAVVKLLVAKGQPVAGGALLAELEDA